ncbi:MAG: tryptophan-rich sensory protein [Paracoccaceae bacterium]
MKVRAVFLLCIAILFAMTPLMLPSFDGYDPQDFPVQILRPSVQPAGYAFSIWLLIYAGLILHAGFGLLRRDTDTDWDAPRLPLAAAMICGIFWVAFAEDHPVIATVTILIMLVCALSAVMTAGRKDRWLLMAPVALFAGWVTAAAGAASGVTLAGLGWLPDTGAAVVCILAVLAVAATVQLRLGRVPEYGLAVIWALAGIVVANVGVNTIVAGLAMIGIIAMAGVIAAANGARLARA